MNCQDFESVAFELARAQLIDAHARAAANEHADSCDVCAGRLRRERALTDALREVGAETRATCAPPRVEAALLAAFRERRVAAPAPTVETVETVRAGSALAFAARTRAARRLIATAAVAASLLLALAAAWRALVPRSSVVDTTVAQIKAGDGKINPIREVNPAPKLADQVAPDINAAIAERTPTAMIHVAHRATPRRADAVESLPISFKMDGGQVMSGEVESSAPQAAPQAADASASADFVQLATGDSSAPLESGQMVRVQVPRAALAALGLPVNAERAGELVKADILLAHDGTARAIRLRP
jgi:hypothetical protein